MPGIFISHPAWLKPDSERHSLTTLIRGQRALIRGSLWHCGVKVSSPSEELGAATHDGLPGTWCKICEEGGWPPWVLMVGLPRVVIGCWHPCCPQYYIKRGENPCRAYTRDPFSRAGSRPLVALSSELVLHSDLDKSYPKPVCQHYLIGTSS